MLGYGVKEINRDFKSKKFFKDSDGYFWKSPEERRLWKFDAYGMPQRRKRCCNCGRMSYKWQRINRGPAHCFDGCFHTTGIDRRKLWQHR